MRGQGLSDSQSGSAWTEVAGVWTVECDPDEEDEVSEGDSDEEDSDSDDGGFGLRRESAWRS